VGLSGFTFKKKKKKSPKFPYFHYSNVFKITLKKKKKFEVEKKDREEERGWLDLPAS